MIVRFSASAQADIQAIFDYIAEDNPHVARRVILAIEQAINRLGRFPFSGRIGAVETTRELVIPRRVSCHGHHSRYCGRIPRCPGSPTQWRHELI